MYYLQPGPFFALDEEKGEGAATYAIGPFAAFVEDAFADLAMSGAQDLIIDLRGNPGGDASFSDLVMRRIADEPYGLSSSYRVRTGANTKTAWTGYQIVGDDLGDRVA